MDAQAKGLLPPLLAQTARVPWDDRRAFDAHVGDLRPDLVRGFLREVGSSLADDPDPAAIFRRMRLTMRANDHELPRNVGLLFFSDDPEAVVPRRQDRGRCSFRTDLRVTRSSSVRSGVGW